MVTTAEIRPNVLASWIDRLPDHFGRDVSKVEVAKLLGKTERMIDYYLAGRYTVPLDMLYLMEAIEAGFRPKSLKQTLNV